MAFINNKLKKSNSFANSQSMKPRTILLSILLFTVPAFFLLHISSPSLCTTFTSHGTVRGPGKAWSGDLRTVVFSWNRLQFSYAPPRIRLKIAVFTRKWPIGATPGGMERHAYTLHSALARRGHRVHVFTSPPPVSYSKLVGDSNSNPRIHCHEGEAGRWRYNKAWEQFQEENNREPFHVVHSESVALPHWVARNVPNLVVTWHGIALESLQSEIYQDLARRPGDAVSQSFNDTIRGVVPKVLAEIRFFQNYAHHVAISDSCGEMLRDVYQIPTRRVHVIVNGVDDHDFGEDSNLGRDFRAKIGIPRNASVVMGVAGRLVKDKGHPILHQAFLILAAKHRDVYLIVAGSGPWENRYRDLGSRVVVLGSMSPTELRGFYNAIDVFVNPTMRPQGLDLTLMEAMMSGKAVAASRFPSIKGTIVVEEEFGFMFAPNVESLVEALEEVVEEGPERLARRGKACKQYAASMFTASKMALAYETLFLCITNQTFCSYP